MQKKELLLDKLYRFHAPDTDGNEWVFEYFCDFVRRGNGKLFCEWSCPGYGAGQVELNECDVTWTSLLALWHYFAKLTHVIAKEWNEIEQSEKEGKSVGIPSNTRQKVIHSLVP